MLNTLKRSLLVGGVAMATLCLATAAVSADLQQRKEAKKAQKEAQRNK